MPPANASIRTELPLDLRVYGLEGIADTQDTAITRQGVTLAEHEEKLGDHAVILATHTEQIGGVARATAALGEAMSKLTNALYVAALAVAGSSIGVGVAIALSH